MKFYLCILLVSFAVLQVTVVHGGHGHGGRGKHHFGPNMCCNVENTTERQEIMQKLKDLFDECKKEVTGGMYSF